MRLNGAARASARMTREQVLAIRQDPRSYHLIAKFYGLHPNTVRRIKKGIIWHRMV